MKSKIINNFLDITVLLEVKQMKKGLIQIYTGKGKGKTTAAIGQAIRAIGQGLEVGLVYFHKNPEEWDYGELKELENFGIKVRGFAKKHPHFYDEISKETMREESLKGLEYVKNIFEEDSLDVLILDEIIISLRDGYLYEKELMNLLSEKPDDIEVILTGRGATDKLIEKADLVSKMENIKHPFQKGVESRKGIDY